MKPLFASLFAAGIALGVHAAQGEETIAVLDLRSRAHPVVAAEASDRVRETVRRMLPDARIVDRESDGDFVLAGRVSHGGLGYRVWLELRDRNGDVLQKASATANTRRELVEAVEGAAADLLRSRREAGAFASGAMALPAVPAPSEPSQDALNLDADSGVLVAYDRARRIEAHGREAPEDAAAAWRRLANMPGQNPFREMAISRAQQWEAYAAGRRAVDAQLARDTARLRRVLPLESLTDSAKIDLLVRFASLHGFDKVSPLVALLPSAPLRERAELSLDCEVKEARACQQLARIADEGKDAKAAQELLDRACAAGAGDACAEAGDRWLSGDGRDPARAIAALQRGCESSNAAACVRLARMYEEGDGTAPNAKSSADLREKACAAGDGKSCRRLAGMSDEPGRIADLLRKGCDGGDSVSCALASREPAIVQRQLQEAAAAATKSPAMVKPAKATETAPAKPLPSSPKTEVDPPRDRTATGAAMIAFGAIAGTTALMLTSDDGGVRRSSRFGRELTTGSSPSSGRIVLGVAIGSAAVISTVAGLAVLLSKPDAPEGTKVAVGASPAGVVVSGHFP